MSSVSGGGLDIQTIVSQLIYAEGAPIRRLQTQKSTMQTQAAAYDSVNTQLSNLYSAMQSLQNASGFGAKSVTTTDKTILSGSAAAYATPGTYNVTISQLANNHSFAPSTYFASTTEQFNTGGSLTLTVGGTEHKIDVTAANNTLTGLKDAINNSGAGVQAFIVSKMVDGSLQYGIGLTSQTTGSAGKITVAVDGVTSTSNGTPLGFSEVANTGQDAQFAINGIQFNSSTNTVTDAIDGLTLNLNNVTTGSGTSMTVAGDTSAVKSKIQSFVDNFNSLMTYVNRQFTYNPSDPSSNPPLAGDSGLRRIQDELLSLVSEPVSSLDQSLTQFRQIGIEMQNDGTLTIDSSKLDDALNDNFAQVQNLFQNAGKATSDSVSFVSAGNLTVPGSYAVHVDQPAKQAFALGTTAISGIVGATTLAITLNGGTPLSVSTNGSGTLQDAVNQINAAAVTAGTSVRARVRTDSGSSYLDLYSTEYGSGQRLSVTDSNSVFGLPSGEQVGQNVKGSIGGGPSTEGVGQILSGAAGTSAEGLSIQVTWASDTPSDLGTISVSKGYASLIAEKMYQYTDTANGPIYLAKNSLSQEMSSIDSQILAMQDRLDERQAMYISQYSKADAALKQMAQIQSTLNQIGR